MLKKLKNGRVCYALSSGEENIVWFFSLNPVLFKSKQNEFQTKSKCWLGGDHVVTVSTQERQGSNLGKYLTFLILIEWFNSEVT